MSELAVLLEPTRPGFLISLNSGTHEFGHVYWEGGPRYKLRSGFDRAGGSHLVHCAVDNERARLEWSCGRVTEVPRSWFQLTYLLG